MIDIEEFKQSTVIKVIGVGGGGGNAVAHMIERQVQGVEFVCANTDAQALARSAAHKTIQLGTSGRGVGSDPVKGRKAAETSEDAIREAIDGAHMLFITAGMGGGTGTGAAPVIARIAKEMGILTVGVVTKPFDWEGTRRMTNADNGLAELEANVDSLIVVLNEKLLEVLGDEVTQDEAFAHANDVLKNAVGGIAEIINEYGNVNVDFEDVRTVMGEPGKAMMGTAAAAGPDRARIAAEQAVACPLLEGIDLSGAKGVLVLVTAAKGSLKLAESKLAMNTIRTYASPDAHVIYGAAYDDNLGDQMRVTVVATGLSRHGQQRRNAPPLKVLRTGTDNMTTVNKSSSRSSANPQTGEVKFVPQSDYSNMTVPSVWRSSRAEAAAKVDALSLNGEMEGIELPAFLRRQASPLTKPTTQETATATAVDLEIQDTGTRLRSQQGDRTGSATSLGVLMGLLQPIEGSPETSDPVYQLVRPVEVVHTVKRFPAWIEHKAITEAIRLSIRLRFAVKLADFAVDFLIERAPDAVAARFLEDAYRRFSSTQMALVGVFPSNTVRTIGSVRVSATGQALLCPFSYWHIIDPDDRRNVSEISEFVLTVDAFGISLE